MHRSLLAFTVILLASSLAAGCIDEDLPFGGPGEAAILLEPIHPQSDELTLQPSDTLTFRIHCQKEETIDPQDVGVRWVHIHPATEVQSLGEEPANEDGTYAWNATFEKAGHHIMQAECIALGTGQSDGHEWDLKLEPATRGQDACDTTIATDQTIQHAIDDANPGDSLCLEPGTYHEGITISTDRVTIRSTDHEPARLDGQGALQDGLRIQNADHVTIENLHIQRYNETSIHINASHHATIKGTTLTQNQGPGLWALDADNATLQNNTITDNGWNGILIDYANNATVHHNTITDSDTAGIRLWGASHATLHHNTVTDNRQGIYLWSQSHQNNAHHNTITENAYGVLISSANNNTLHDNTIAHNERAGIQIDSRSHHTTLAHNNIQENDGYGLHVRENAGRIHAPNNWWGHASGPSGETEDACTHTTTNGQGALLRAQSPTCYEPWLTQPTPRAGAS